MLRDEYDKETDNWFKDHPDAETTVTQCEDCGLYYKPCLGHKCKVRKSKPKSKVKAKETPSDTPLVPLYYIDSHGNYRELTPEEVYEMIRKSEVKSYEIK